jgi:hypothetical protein
MKKWMFYMQLDRRDREVKREKSDESQNIELENE